MSEAKPDLRIRQLVIVHRHGERSNYLAALDEHLPNTSTAGTLVGGKEGAGWSNRCSQLVEMDGLCGGTVQQFWKKTVLLAKRNRQPLTRLQVQVLDNLNNKSQLDACDLMSGEARSQIDSTSSGCLPGQLTDSGKAGMLAQGRVFEKEYASFLPSVTPSHMLVHSTQYARTLESVQHLLTGMFGPRMSEARVFIRPKLRLFPDWSDGIGCRALRQLLEPFQQLAVSNNTAKMDAIVPVMSALFPNLNHIQNNHPHATILDKGTFAQLNTYFDALVAWDAAGFNLGGKTANDSQTQQQNHMKSYEAMMQLSTVANQLLFHSFRDAGEKDPRVFRLGMGRVLGDICAVMSSRFDSSQVERTVNDSAVAVTLQTYVKDLVPDSVAASEPILKDLKLAVFSGHDTTIAPLIASLGAYRGYVAEIWPPFGSHVVFEVVEHVPSSLTSKLDSSQQPSIDNHYVRVRYNSDPLKLPFCQGRGSHFSEDPSLCRMDVFLKAVGKLVPGDYDAECK
ncbi:hypothetical protein HDU77_000763 [Chytriomyces hyalinus]|nr:hypothetical protein HDU77_000763 [Chytriomyces hyalinus]